MLFVLCFMKLPLPPQLTSCSFNKNQTDIDYEITYLSACEKIFFTNGNCKFFGRNVVCM